MGCGGVTPVRMLSRAEDPDAWARAAAMPTSWLPFMLEDLVAAACLTTVGARYPDHQLTLLDGDEAVGKVRSVPLPWQVGRRDLPAHGWDAVLVEAAGAEDGPATGVATLLEATVRPDLQGRGLSRELLVLARKRLRALGVVELFAPVRPSGALTPVHVDVEADHAVYVEPDVWVRHDLTGG